MNYDFTVKKQWNEVKTDSTYTATFDYLNGKQEIPLQGKKGQKINISIDFNNKNGGGYVYRILKDKGKFVGMNEVSDGNIDFDVQDPGVYRVVITGDGLEGSFNVNWE